MSTPQRLTPYQSRYIAWRLTRRAAGDSLESLASTLVDSQVDLNPHQVEAALFACQNPLARGVILADEVGLGKTIEASLVISQCWAERRRRVLIITPANLRKQWQLENFDEQVHDKLRIRAEDSRNTRNKYERMLNDLTHSILGDCAAFDAEGFELLCLPEAGQAELWDVALGRYELPRRTGNAHLYRVNHPLAQWVANQAKTQDLPAAKLYFDYAAYGSRISTLEPYRGKTGWLSVKLLVVDTLGHREEHLLVAATTHDGLILAEEDPEKLLRLPAQSQEPTIAIDALPPILLAEMETRQNTLLREIKQRNLGYFEQEVQKLDAWADDLKLGLEQQIKETDREIKETRSTAATSPTLEEKLAWQKKQRDLEAKRSKLRRDLFNRQDEIDAQRNGLIDELERQLEQKVEEQTLFTFEWALI